MAKSSGNFLIKGICKNCEKQDYIANKRKKYCIYCYIKVEFREIILEKEKERERSRIKRNQLYCSNNINSFDLDIEESNNTLHQWLEEEEFVDYESDETFKNWFVGYIQKFYK